MARYNIGGELTVENYCVNFFFKKYLNLDFKYLF